MLLSLCLVACGKQEHRSANARTIQVSTDLASEQILNRHLGADPRTLDPSLATDVVSQRVLDDLFEGLVTLGEDGRTVPGVALTWDTSADGKTWTFHLREDARWSNGQPVTADDFVYAWRREVDPATGSEYAQALAPIENAMDVSSGKLPPARLGVESAGAHTLVVHLHAPTPYLVALLTNAYLIPIYEPAVKQWGDSWTQPGHMISNGAFLLSDRVINGHMTLLKNPYYWDQKDVHVTRVNYYPVSDTNGAVDQYLAGNLDITDSVSLSQKDYLERTLGNQVVFAPYFGTAMLQSHQTAVSGQSEIASGPQYRSGSRYPREIRSARHRNPRVQHHAAAQGLRSRRARLGQHARRPAPRIGAQDVPGSWILG
jgi:oligopeptide transport system substrate-binding protein